MKRSLRSTFVEMRTCRSVAKRLQRYLDGELDAATKVKVERHLETCLKCGLEVSTYARVKAVLARDEGGVSAADVATLDRLRRFAEDLARPAGPPEEPR